MASEGMGRGEDVTGSEWLVAQIRMLFYKTPLLLLNKAVVNRVVSDPKPN